MARSSNLERLLVNDQLTKTGSFNNTNSGLTATSVKEAIDELDTSVDSLLIDKHVAVTLDSGDVTQETLSLVNQALTVNLATSTTDGALASNDKVKLDGIETNATADQVASEVPVSLSATNYTASDAQVEAHLVGLHAAIGTLQTQLVGGVTYKGGYNASTNAPNLETPAAGSVEQGDMFTITADGDFFTASVSIGDVIIAEVEDPSIESEWTIVENNIEDAADVSFDNTASGLTATNVQTAVDQVSSAVNQSSLFAEFSTPSSDITLSSDSKPFQYFTPTADVIVSLPSTPNKAKYFCITNYSTTKFVGVTFGGSTRYLFAKPLTALGQIFPYLSVFWTGSTWAFAGPTSFNFIDSSSGSGANTAVAAGASTMAIGSGANSNGSKSVALGANANVNGTTSIQLGEGNNTTDNTLQYKNVRLANAEGLYTSFTTPTNYSPSDTDNVTSHLQSINTALGTKATLPQPFTVNQQTITTSKNLSTNDPIFQHITSNTVNLNVRLPSEGPINGTRFIIKNDESSSQNINVTGGPVTAILSPGEIYEAVYGTTKWMVI